MLPPTELAARLLPFVFAVVVAVIVMLISGCESMPLRYEPSPIYQMETPSVG